MSQHVDEIVPKQGPNKKFFGVWVLLSMGRTDIWYNGWRERGSGGEPTRKEIFAEGGTVRTVKRMIRGEDATLSTALWQVNTIGLNPSTMLVVDAINIASAITRDETDGT